MSCELANKLHMTSLFAHFVGGDWWSLTASCNIKVNIIVSLLTEGGQSNILPTPDQNKAT